MTTPRLSRWAVPLLLALMLTLAPRPGATQKRVLLQEDVGLVNALNYGSTFDSTTVLAAVSAIGSNYRVLYLPAGTWTLGVNVSIPKNVTLYVPAATVISINAGVTLTLATIPQYDQPYWFSGAGTLLVTDSTWPIDVRVYGAVGDGVADDTTAITKAIAAATTADGGQVLLPCGTYKMTSQISVVNKANLRLIGPAGARGTSATNSSCVTLVYTPQTGAMFRFDGVVGVELGWLNLTYSHASYADALVRLEKLVASGGSSPNTRDVWIHDSAIQGTSTSSKNGILVLLDRVTDVTMERLVFAYGRAAVYGANTDGALVSMIRIRDSRFDSTLTNFPLQLAGIGWTIENNRFSGLSTGAPAALFILTAGVYGMHFTGNVGNITSTAAQSWINGAGGVIVGATIAGNLFQDGGGSSFCIFLTGGSLGVSVVGNYLQCGTSLGGGTDVLYAGNWSGSTAPIGVPPGGHSLTVFPSLGGGAPTAGTGRWRLGLTGSAGGKRVLCYDNTGDVGRIFVSSSDTDCSN